MRVASLLVVCVVCVGLVILGVVRLSSGNLVGAAVCWFTAAVGLLAVDRIVLKRRADRLEQVQKDQQVQEVKREVTAP